MSKSCIINIIEPTLQDETGHCCGYVTTLLESAANPELRLELWIGKKAKKLFRDSANIHPIFYRSIRKIQTFWLYYNLLKKQQIIFIPTAGSLDLIMLNWLAKNIKQPKVFLHFHQFKINPKKSQLLTKVAQQHPEFHILAPTAKLLQIFSQAGFKNCHLTPCPTYQKEITNISCSHKFKNLLFAGAARKDKGFPEIASLVKYLAQNNESIPITLQISANHSGKYDTATQQALTQLEQISYSNLTLYRNSLSQREYQNLFTDAVCLQLYNNDFYADKFSGVTLDALFAGCPIITTNNTWIANTVTRFNAGIVITNTNPDTVFTAIKTIIADFATFQENAINAGKTLRIEHDPRYTLETIYQNCP